MSEATTQTPIVRQLGTAVGAEITGVDLAARLDEAAFGVMHDALMARGVICIRGQQHLSSDDQLAFAQRWGEISIHPYVPSIDGYPGIMEISNPVPITQTWHADSTHMAHPHSLTLLLARVLPPIGGDTMFASTVAAYEDLSPGLTATVETLSAVHQGTELAAEAGLDSDAVRSVHPVVLTHPVSGRRALYVNDNYVVCFDGWTAEESRPLLAYLYSLIERPENVYRHRWQEGDLIIWDNRSVQHAVVADTGGAPRLLHRVTIA